MQEEQTRTLQSCNFRSRYRCFVFIRCVSLTSVSFAVAAFAQRLADRGYLWTDHNPIGEGAFSQVFRAISVRDKPGFAKDSAVAIKQLLAGSKDEWSAELSLYLSVNSCNNVARLI